MLSKEYQIWKVQVIPENRPYFIPHSLAYFAGKFECNKMGDGWHAPPAKLVNKTKPIPDFISWMTRAPVVTEKARSVISEVDSGVEFLDFHPIRGHPTFVMNVRTCIDAIDSIASKPDEDRFVLDERKLAGGPNIFKCKGVWNEIFVSDVFARAAAGNSLSGIGLLRPERPTLRLIVSNEELNEYPGLGR